MLLIMTHVHAFCWTWNYVEHFLKHHAKRPSFSKTCYLAKTQYWFEEKTHLKESQIILQKVFFTFSWYIIEVLYMIIQVAFSRKNVTMYKAGQLKDKSLRPTTTPGGKVDLAIHTFRRLVHFVMWMWLHFFINIGLHLYIYSLYSFRPFHYIA